MLTTEALIERLNALGTPASVRTLEEAVEMGALIRRYCNNSGGGSHTVRRLAQEPALSVSRTVLWRAVKLAEFDERYPVSALKRIRPAHLYPILRLPADAVGELIQRCADEGWTCRRMEQEARRVREVRGLPAGRPAVSPLQRALRDLHRAAEAVERAISDDRLDAKRARAAHQALVPLLGVLERAAGGATCG